MLQTLTKNLGVFGSNEYLKLLTNNNNTVRITASTVGEIQIKSLWVNINFPAYEISLCSIARVAIVNKLDINKIANANRVYKSIISLVYQLNRVASVFKVLHQKTKHSTISPSPNKFILTTVRLFEVSVLDILDALGLYGVKPAILLLKSDRAKLTTKKIALTSHYTSATKSRLDYNNSKIKSLYKLYIPALSINVPSLVSSRLISLINSKISTLTVKHSDVTYLRYKILPSLYRRLNKYVDNILSSHRIFRVLKKKRFQELPYNKLIQVDQFDKQYQNTLRVGEPYPTNNYSNTMLMAFYRVYGYVLLRAMIAQEISKDTWYHRRHEITATAFRSYHHLPTLKEIVFETTIEYKTRRLLSEMYQHYVYRKSTFILIPKNVEYIGGSLDRIYYYFYRDLTESLFPYFRLRLERYRDHPALFESFSSEITNYYSVERKQNSVSIGETGSRINKFKFYPIY